MAQLALQARGPEFSPKKSYKKWCVPVFPALGMQSIFMNTQAAQV